MAKYNLSHPLYLDAQMMFSFLAYLEGGAYISSEETMQEDKTKSGKGKGSGKFKLPSLGPIFGAQAALEGEISGSSTNSAQQKYARHHTFSSLFNGLYEFLNDDKKIIKLEGLVDFEKVSPRDLVEITGRYRGNPLEDILGFANILMGYMEDFGESEEFNSSGNGNRSRQVSGNPKKRPSGARPVLTPEQEKELEEKKSNEIAIKLMSKMREDLQKSPVHDVVLETSYGLNAVLTLSSEYYSQEVREHLRTGEFVAIGKVTRILKEGESINLNRRTVLGATGTEISENMVEGMANDQSIDLDIMSPIIKPPALQVIPMAIFI